MLTRVAFGTLEHGREYVAFKVDEPILHRGLCMRTTIRHLRTNISGSMETEARNAWTDDSTVGLRYQ